MFALAANLFAYTIGIETACLINRQFMEKRHRQPAASDGPVRSTSAGTEVASALPMPILMVNARGELIYANQAAEQFFAMGLGLPLKQKLADLLPFGSPLIQLVQQARERGASVAERNVDLSTPKLGERLADVTLTPSIEREGAVILLLQERSLAQRIDRQLL